MVFFPKLYNFMCEKKKKRVNKPEPHANTYEITPAYNEVKKSHGMYKKREVMYFLFNKINLFTINKSN